MDINGDGEDDLLIGVPRYSKILKKGKRPEYDVGRVIILLQENGKLNDKSLIEIKGIDIHGQFGFDIRKGKGYNGYIY